MKRISLLGATGSIGSQTLDVIKEHSEHFQLTALSFGENIDKGAKIIQEFKPEFVAVKNKAIKDKLESLITIGNTRIEVGNEAMIEAATLADTDVLVNAVMGSIGLWPTIEAIRAGKSIALANKETLVTAGHLVMALAEQYQVSLYPIDSEHSAIFQAMNGENPRSVNRLILTASGGSFRDYRRDELKGVTVKDALNHPNWSMGAKITIDSATMMNKGLEVIEAHWLFNIPYERIDVVLHKESIVHSLVEYIDKSVLAQLGHPDMRETISYALSFPERLERSYAKTLNLWEVGALHFDQMDVNRFKALKLAYEAGKVGGTATTVLNAANEVAVQAFLEDKIEFLSIDDYIETMLEQHKPIAQPDLETVLATDEETRRLTAERIRHTG